MLADHPRRGRGRRGRARRRRPRRPRAITSVILGCAAIAGLGDAGRRRRGRDGLRLRLGRGGRRRRDPARRARPRGRGSARPGRCCPSPRSSLPSVAIAAAGVHVAPQAGRSQPSRRATVADDPARRATSPGSGRWSSTCATRDLPGGDGHARGSDGGLRRTIVALPHDRCVRGRRRLPRAPVRGCAPPTLLIGDARPRRGRDGLRDRSTSARGARRRSPRRRARTPHDAAHRASSRRAAASTCATTPTRRSRAASPDWPGFPGIVEAAAGPRRACPEPSARRRSPTGACGARAERGRRARQAPDRRAVRDAEDQGAAAMSDTTTQMPHDARVGIRDAAQPRSRPPGGRRLRGDRRRRAGDARRARARPRARRLGGGRDHGRDRRRRRRRVRPGPARASPRCTAGRRCWSSCSSCSAGVGLAGARGAAAGPAALGGRCSSGRTASDVVHVRFWPLALIVLRGDRRRRPGRRRDARPDRPRAALVGGGARSPRTARRRARPASRGARWPAWR